LTLTRFPAHDARMQTPASPALLACSPATAVLLVFLGAGCGGGLKYRVDDSAMDAIPAGERQTVFAAQNDLEIAKSETRTATTQLDSIARDTDIAKTEKQQADLEVEKAIAEQEGAVASRDENRAAASKHAKDAADLGVKAAEAKLSWLDAKKDWLKASLNAANAHVGAAQAKVELEKAKVAQQKGIKPDSDFAVSNYQDQYNDQNDDWQSAKKKAASEEKDAKEAEKKWQDLTAQVQKMKT
jgi:chromosome segregation ATPase